jgi:hypothetical protein
MTWRDVVNAFDDHPEVKYCDQSGSTCTPGTRGILYRHHLKIGRIEYIGKESNRLTEKDEPLPDLADYEVPEYCTGRDDVRELVLPVLQTLIPNYSNRELARRIRVDEASIRRFMARDNLTYDMRIDVRRVRDYLIGLATILAVKTMADVEPGWHTKHGQSAQWREILETWRRNNEP